MKSNTIKVVAQGYTNEKNPTAMILVRVSSTTPSKDILIERFNTILDVSTLKRKLINAGVSPRELEGKRWKEIKSELTKESSSKLIVSTKPGFLNKHYLDTNGTIFGKKSKTYRALHCQSMASVPESQKGDLDKWRENLACYSKYSSRLMLAMCAGFSGVIAEFMGQESGGFHFFGDSSIGKSTCLLLANSVFGPPKRICSWSTTEAAIEETASNFNNSTLILDELAALHSDPKISAQLAAAITYKIAEGVMKRRSTKYQQNTLSWNICMLSAGELSLNENSHNGGRLRMTGEEVRLIDIPALANETHGIYDFLPPNKDDAGEISDTIKDLCKRYHGTARAAFIQGICNALSDSRKTLKCNIRNHMKDFLAASKPRKGPEKRAAKRFAIAYASGCLAIEYGILLFSKTTIMERILKAFEDYRSSTPINETQLNEENFEHLVNTMKLSNLISLSQLNELKSTDDFENGNIIIRYKRKEKSVVIISRDFLKSLVPSTDQRESLLKHLAYKNYLIKSSDNKNTIKAPSALRTKNKNLRCHALSTEILV